MTEPGNVPFTSLPSEPRAIAAEAAGPRSAYLPGLDGARALSVAAVILFHAEVAGFGGGFLGVEVFFVISGYIITSLLLRELAESGTISLAAFWRRRARRILPALYALMVMVAVVALGRFPDAYAGFRDDLPGALLFVSNWWQLVRHQSYFLAIDRPPLLQHVWSLAIEEQFYLVWPLTVFLLGRSKGRSWLVLTAAVVAVASSLWMMWSFDPLGDPSRVYFGTDTRLGGLMLGALFAAWQPVQRVRSERSGWVVRGLLDLGAVAAMAVIGLAIGHLHGRSPLLYRGALPMVDLATLWVLAAAVQPGTLTRIVLGHPLLAAIGRRSYSLYLWHWPVFALTRPVLDTQLEGISLLILRLGISIALAELSYRFIEEPLRRASVAKPRRHDTEAQSTVANTRQPPTWQFLGACVFMLLLLVASEPTLAAMIHDRPEAVAHAADNSDPPTNSLAIPPADSTSTRPAPSVSSAATVASASANPASKPVKKVLGAGIPVDPSWPKTMTVISDSVALSIGPSLQKALPDWKVEVLGRPALMVSQAVPEFLKNRKVGSVVVVGLAHNSIWAKDRLNYDHFAKRWDDQADRLLDDLKARGARKIVWITLREPSPGVVTQHGRRQYELYAWFFPYVNQQLEALVTRHPDVALVDWRAVSDIPKVTTDLIHLSHAGIALMTKTIVDTVFQRPVGDQSGGSQNQLASPHPTESNSPASPG